MSVPLKDNKPEVRIPITGVKLCNLCLFHPIRASSPHRVLPLILYSKVDVSLSIPGSFSTNINRTIIPPEWV